MNVPPIPAGPGKKKKPRRAQSYTTHKSRSAWFQARTTYPEREADAGLLAKAQDKSASLPATEGVDWEDLGPVNVGGRITSLVVHPGDPETVYVGSAGGGVWRSSDAGKTWEEAWNRSYTGHIGALAIDPAQPDNIFCGTGEANGSVDSYPGDGVYKSVDGGKTWLLTGSSQQGLPRRIGVIAVDPFDSKHIRLGGVAHALDHDCAMFTSRDGGLTWSREDFVSTAGYWCNDIVFHPTQPGIILACVYERGAKNGIWRSIDHGASWQQLTRGLPPPEQFGRSTVRFAPSQPAVVYALAASDSQSVLGVFRSADGGDSWTSIEGHAFEHEGQMAYGNCLAVHPKNPDQVLCGGVDLHLTTDGGKTWSQVTDWTVNRGESNYAHGDHHAIVPAGATDRIYDANDGGVDVSDDGGRTWTNRSAGLAVTMFYALDVSGDGASVGGGTQDNGVVVSLPDPPKEYFRVVGGDGGWLVYDPKDAKHLYAASAGMVVFRYRDSDGWKEVTPPATPEETQRVWMAYLTMAPSDSNVIFIGSTRVWKTADDGETWKPISPVLDGFAISALEIPRTDPNRIYAGTEKGGVFRTLDGGATWSGNLAGAVLPGTIVTRIETHPLKPDLLFASTGGTGRSHMFRSDDGAMTWVDIDKGKLPDVPHHAVVLQTESPNNLYVANDAGVFTSSDLGENWHNVTRNLPNVSVVDLVYHDAGRTVTAATYGRGLWRLQC